MISVNLAICLCSLIREIMHDLIPYYCSNKVTELQCDNDETSAKIYDIVACFLSSFYLYVQLQLQKIYYSSVKII